MKELVNYCSQLGAYKDSEGFAIWGVSGKSDEEINLFVEKIKNNSTKVWDEYNFLGRMSDFTDKRYNDTYKGDLIVFSRFGHYTG